MKISSKWLLIIVISILSITIMSCNKEDDEKGENTTNSLNGTTWQRSTSEYVFVYSFTSSGYTQRTKYSFLGNSYDDVIDNGSYIVEKNDITLYSGMGAGIITGTISGKSMVLRGYTYSKK